MNRQQFDKFLEQYTDAFPDTLGWLEKLEHPGKTLNIWFEVMEPVEVHDAEVVLAKMISGDSPTVERFEIQNTPRIIRQRAFRIADERRQKAVVAEERARYDRKGKYRPLHESAGDAGFTKFWKRALELGRMVKEGKITQEENKRLMAEATEEWERTWKYQEATR